MNGNHEASAYLEALASRLSEAGLLATASYDGDEPQLAVANPDLAVLACAGPTLVSENIQLKRQGDGAGWMLYWSWGEVLGPADDIPAALAALSRALAADQITAPAGYQLAGS